ncbi:MULTISPECIES: NAD-dependent epimerase/dehydratase family protein [unclassified Paenibacillus]|uniref:NAD-dependent epimerase/dehydratase family protein n=1 Tax=unclassified Paenibacillus TaxID=185978 RepID=UPI003631DF57
MNTNSSGLFTVIGAQGFMGRHLVSALRSQGKECFAPERDDPTVFQQSLGHVIYCAGVTSDFRQRPFDTMKAHVSLAGEFLEKAAFDSFVYISSTRIYMDNLTSNEQVSLSINPHHRDHLFHLSKLAGESLCLNSGRENVKIARVSNVCGDDYNSGNFLYSLIHDAVDKKQITLHTTLDTAKDYIGIDDVVRLLISIAQADGSGVYNVASGINTSNRSISQWIRELTGCQVSVADAARTVCFPLIDVTRIHNELGYENPDCEALIRGLIAECTEELKRQGLGKAGG